MRLFVLVRDQDLSGFSGTGVVAEGVEFGDGRVVMRWVTNGVHSMVLHASIDELLKVHGHNGASRIEWLAEQGEKA